MTCNVILTAKSGRFIAQVAELPYCKAEANSRNQALALIQKRLEAVVKRSEIVQVKIASSPAALSSTFRKTQKTSLPQTVKVGAPISAHDKTVHRGTPWEYFGIFKNDPTWLPLLDEIEKKRDAHVVHPKKKRKK